MSFMDLADFELVALTVATVTLMVFWLNDFCCVPHKARDRRDEPLDQILRLPTESGRALMLDLRRLGFL